MVTDATVTITAKDIFLSSFVCYEPGEIKKIRLMLGESTTQFAERFFVDRTTVSRWEAKRGSGQFREVTGAAARLMYWAAAEANSKASSKGNLIRLAVNWRD